MKKYLALLLVAVMAVSVLSAANVVTAKKTQLPARYEIQYGQNQEWTGRQCNYHSTFVSPATTAGHSERSVKDTASILISAANGKTGTNNANVGVQWKLTGISDWNTQQMRQVAITVTITYDAAARGGDQYTWASVGASNIKQLATANVQTPEIPTTTATYRMTENYNSDPLTVGTFTSATDEGYTGGFWIILQSGIWGSSTTHQQTSASVTIQSVAIEYL